MKWLVLTCLALVSCEKNIDFNLKETPEVLVVDASIENGKPPLVVLTKSFGFFSTVSPELLANSFIHDASVVISKGSEEHALKEYHFDSSGGYRIYYYSTDTSNANGIFTGELNTSYQLRIIYGDKEYSAITTIPPLAKKPDSMWWKPAPFNADTNKVVVMTRIIDPPGLGNYIRYFTSKNRGPFLPGENSVYDDQFIDGSTYEIPVEPGIDRNNKIKYEDNYFRKGDTVVLKMCNIDRTTFKFWSSMEFAYQGNGNPFASPVKVIGNISNGGLGAFCGYAAAYKTLIIH
ncbi:MAG: DUF4249 family protein [Ginsengibacter sp.]